MIFKPFYKDNQIFYYSAQNENYSIVYGTRHLKKNDLRTLFPNYSMCFVQQVHGNKVIRAQEKKLIPADAHWTCDKNQALVVQTADCLPIFMTTPHQVCAIHAGWRGVEKQITLKALLCFQDSNNLEVSIGPHIMSFIVDKDVALRLAKSSPQGEKYISPQNQEKYHASLVNLVQAQILSKIEVKNWNLLPFDTFSEEIFHSFRRTSEKKIGQYSFVVRI